MSWSTGYTLYTPESCPHALYCAKLCTLVFLDKSCVAHIMKNNMLECNIQDGDSQQVVFKKLLRFNQICLEHHHSCSSHKHKHRRVSRFAVQPCHPETAASQNILEFFDHTKKVKIQVFIKPPIIYVVIRPTFCRRNWMSDLDIRAVPIHEDFFVQGGSSKIKVGRIHHGFKKILASSAVQELKRVFNSLLSSDISNVIITGMSLGSAMAPLIGVLLSKHCTTPAVKFRCVSFAGPVFGDERLNKPITGVFASWNRIESKRDVIPRIHCPLLTHKHAGNAILYDDGCVGDWLYEGAPRSGLSYLQILYLRKMNVYGHGYQVGIMFHYDFKNNVNAFNQTLFKK
jgi:hypothetical protein